MLAFECRVLWFLQLSTADMKKGHCWDEEMRLGQGHAQGTKPDVARHSRASAEGPGERLQGDNGAVWCPPYYAAVGP